jgi:RNA polymerase sigma-B factor
MTTTLSPPTPTSTTRPAAPRTAPARPTRPRPVDDPRRAAEDRALFERYAETRDRAVRNEIIERHSHFAIALARRFRQRGEPLDDLQQVALLGLLKAVERFDLERGVPFHAFAKPTIVGELRRHFRDHGWSVRVPRGLQELRLQLAQLMPELGQTLGRSPTVAELAAAAGASEDDVIAATEADNLYQPDSLDREVRGEAGDSAPTARGELVGTEDGGFATVEERETLALLLQRLPERDRRVVYLRFYEDLTQSEIARELGISQMHVSRLLSRSLARMAPGGAST